MPSEDVRYKEDCSVWKTTFVWKLKNKQTYKQTNSISSTIRPGNSDPFYTVSYYIYIWVTTYWTYSTILNGSLLLGHTVLSVQELLTQLITTVCPGSSDPFYIVS